jgi:hypothetical protein
MFLLKSCKATAFDWDHHTLCVHNMWKYIIQLLNHVFPHDNLTWDASYVVNTYTKMFFWKSCKATWALEFSTKTFLYVYIFTKAVWMCTWCLLVSVGICWCLLESVGICWCLLVLVSVGVCWCLLVSVGVCWCLLVSVGVCWCLLVSVGVCWYYIPHLGMEKVGVAWSVHCLMSIHHTIGHMLVSAYTMMFLWKSCKATAFDCDFHILCFFNVEHYIPHLGMEKTGVARSVHCSTSVCCTIGILQHECRRVTIFDQK